CADSGMVIFSMARPPRTCDAERAFDARLLMKRLEPVGPQRVIDLRPITRLRRLGAAGSEQSVARPLTDATTRPINASRQGATRLAPRCSRETIGPEEPSYAETPVCFRGAGPRWCASMRLS